MRRELNQTLFATSEEASSSSTNEAMTSRSQVIDALESGADGKSVLMQQIRLKLVESEREIQSLKLKIKELERNHGSQFSKLEEIFASIKSRAERQSRYQKGFEQALQSKFQEISGKFAQISSKLTERKVADTKVQQMMDRHNSIVASFEQRLSQMQKVINEQDLKILNLTSLLKDQTRY
jgi:chromosome segregation ATPase